MPTRILRPTVFFTATFALAWALFGTLLALARALGDRDRFGDPLLLVGRVALTWGVLGAIAGVVFSVTLALVARGQSIGVLSRTRVATLGAFAGASGVLVGLVERGARASAAGGIGAILVNVAVCAALGSVSTWLILWLARERRGTIGQVNASNLLDSGSIVAFSERRPAREEIGVETQRACHAQQVGQANVNGTKLRALTIPLPPREEQDQIVAVARDRLEQSRRLRADVDLQLARASRLRHSILRRAFEGKLVPQDPNEEPADRLLQRTSTEGVDAPFAPQTRDRPARSRVGPESRSAGRSATTKP